MRYPTLPEKFPLCGLTSAMLIAVLAAGPGCSVVKFAGKATVTTIAVTTDVACATVRGTGKVACTAADVSFDVASGGVKAAAKLSKQGAVVFFNPLTGVVSELPWRKNLTLLAATQIAGLDGATHAVRLIRAGQTIETTHRDAKLMLAPGDVVELAPHRRA